MRTVSCLLCVILWCSAREEAVEEREVGLCWIRNEVQYDLKNQVDYSIDQKEWGFLYISALSVAMALNRKEIKTCLYTDAPMAVVIKAFDVLSANEKRQPFAKAQGSKGLIDYIYSDYDEHRNEHGILQRVRALGLEQQYKEMISTDVGNATIKKIHSRLGRMRFFGMAKFDITLFIDDDTLFCPHPDLALQLRTLIIDDNRLIRICEHETSFPKSIPQVQNQANRLLTCSIKSKHNLNAATSIIKNCWNDHSCTSFIRMREPRLQAGVILLRGNTHNAAALEFTSEWMREYINYWHWAATTSTPANYSKIKFNDQLPLNTIAKRKCTTAGSASSIIQSPHGWSLAANPPELNGRYLTDKTHKGAAIFGPVALLHSSGLFEPFQRVNFTSSSHILSYYHKQVCAEMNRISGPRYVHGDAVDLLKRSIAENNTTSSSTASSFRNITSRRPATATHSMRFVNEKNALIRVFPLQRHTSIHSFLSTSFSKNK